MTGVQTCALPIYLNGLPLAGILVTAVHREDAMAGTDLPLMEDVADAADVPVFASGGLGSVNDLRALADRGVQHVTLHAEDYSLSLFIRGQACVCAVHRASIFLPGVREKFSAVAEELSRDGL